MNDLQKILDEGGRVYIPTPKPLTLRDYFAGQALAGLCANSGMIESVADNNEGEDMPTSYAKMAVTAADALLAELAKEKTT